MMVLFLGADGALGSVDELTFATALRSVFVRSFGPAAKVGAR